MNNILEKRDIVETNSPIVGHGYNVKIWRSVDGGKSWFYCGGGKLFRTEEEAQAFASESNI